MAPELMSVAVGRALGICGWPSACSVPAALCCPGPPRWPFRLQSLYHPLHPVPFREGGKSSRVV